MNGADPDKRGPADADYFQLAGDGIEIVVGPGLPGAVRLGFDGAPPVRTFGEHEVISEHGPMGHAVSVSPQAYDDQDRITLTVLLPSARMRAGHRVPVSALAILTVWHGSPGAATGGVRRRNIIVLDGHASVAPGLSQEPVPQAGVADATMPLRVPSLIGLVVPAAHDAALDAGALAVVQNRPHAGATVTAQTPLAGHVLSRGQTIRIWAGDKPGADAGPQRHSGGR